MMGFEILPYAYLLLTREALLYALKMVDYTGFFGIDINPERMPVLEAVKVNERVDALPHDKILDCFYHPDRNPGTLQMILAESFSPRKR